MHAVPRVAARLTGFGLLFGVAAGLVGQLVPPFHVLAHELVQVSALLGGLVQLELAAASIRAFPYRPGRLEASFVASMAGALAMGAGLQAVTWVANETVHGCETAGTGLFLWVTWGPLALLVTVIGMALAGMRPVLRVATFYAIMVACLAHDQLRTDLGLTMADPLLGFVLALDQRAPMELSPAHVLQRGWLLLVGLAGLAALLWTQHRDGARAALAVVTGAVAATITVGWGGQLGLGLGEGPRRMLDGTHQTEHLRVRFDRSGSARHRAAMVGREGEWQLHRLASAWGIALDGVEVRIDLYDDVEDLRRATGRPFPHAGRRRAALTWRDGLGEALAHELVHAVQDLAGRPPWVVDPSRGRTEGSAVAWTDGYAQVAAAHAPLAALLERGQLPAAERLMSLSGFWTVPEGLAYQASGSFVGFLILEHGVPAWRTWLRTQDEAEAFGKELVQLDREWRAFLRDLPVDPTAPATPPWVEARMAAATERTCPKLGRRVPGLAEDARAAHLAGNHGRALQLYERLARERPDQQAAWWAVVDQLQALDRHPEALHALASSPEAWRYGVRWWDVTIRSWTALGDVDNVRQALAHRLGIAPQPELRALYHLLAEPELREPVLRLMRTHEARRPSSSTSAASSGAASEIVAAYRGRFPEHAEHWSTLATMSLTDLPRPGDTSLTSAQQAQVRQLQAWLGAVPRACEGHGERWVEAARSLAQLQRQGLAAGLAETLQGRCTDPVVSWRVSEVQRRLAWSARGPRVDNDR